VTAGTNSRGSKPGWVKTVAKYQTPVVSTSVWQIVNSFIPFFALWLLAYFSLSYSYVLTLAITVLAAGFIMRIFIIQHDCGHNSFFKSRKLNDLVGTVCGVLTITPYEMWRTSHALHHATSGDLDNRGWGDVTTMTVNEYKNNTRLGRLKYRLYRNPFIMFGFGPAYMFIINQRTPVAIWTADTKRAKRSLIFNDLMIIALYGTCMAIFGVGNFIKIQLPISIVAATLGVWLFYVQHNFEDTYWRAHPEWNYTEAALQGSSYYKMPKLFQWFTGNIGLHHIHHLSPRIPNYLLEKVHEENPEFQSVPTLTIRSSLQILTSRLALWDEDQQKMVSFKQVHEQEKQAQQLAVANS